MSATYTTCVKVGEVLLIMYSDLTAFAALVALAETNGVSGSV
ncbi:MAG TPA: hypothetical protein VFC02_27585 [Anaerolineales bacterium]|nr:hypothetical protein [Anaerolineales bacterium]